MILHFVIFGKQINLVLALLAKMDFTGLRATFGDANPGSGLNLLHCTLPLSKRLNTAILAGVEVLRIGPTGAQPSGVAKRRPKSG